MTRLYYEGHITLDPNSLHSTVEWAKFVGVCDAHKMRISTFLMTNAVTGKPDAFTSMRDTDYATIYDRIASACDDLTKNGFRVKRVKIEDTLMDTKHGDPFPSVDK